MSPARDSLGPSPGSGALLVLVTAAILLATLAPAQGYADRNPILLTRHDGVRGALDVLANVWLFVPFGLALAARRAGWMGVLVAGFVLSMSIEAAQIIVPGRYPALTDLLTNTSGALAGFGLHAVVGRRRVARLLGAVDATERTLRHPGPRLAPWLYAGALGLPAGAALLGAALSIPLTPDRPLLVAPTRIDPGDRLSIGSASNAGSFCGAVDDLRVYDRALDQREIGADAGRPVRAGAPDAPLASWSFDGPPTTTPAIAAAGAAGAQDVEFAAGRRGEALRLQDRRAVFDLGPAPPLHLAEAFTIAAWIRPERTDCGPAILDGGDSAYFLHLGIGSDPLRPYGGGRFSSTYEGALSGEAVPLGRWSHLALTYDARRLRLFVDGQLMSIREIGTPALRAASAGAARSLPGERLDAVPWPFSSPGTLRVELEGAPAPADAIEPLVRLHSSVRDSAWVGRAGDDLIVRYRPRFAALGLPPVEYRAPAPGNAGTARVIRIDGEPRKAWIRADDGPQRPIGLRPSEWWSRVTHARELPAWLQAVVTLALSAAVAVPAGYYAGLVPKAAWLALAAVPLWHVVSAAVPMLAPAALETVTGFAGLAAGYALAARAGTARAARVWVDRRWSLTRRTGL